MSTKTRKTRSDALTQKRKALALEEFARTGRRVAAARAAGCSPKTIDRHRESDKDFGTAWDDAQAEYVELLEAEAHRRAIDGTETEKLDRAGCVISRETKYSDGLLKLLLSANASEKYASNLHVKKETTVRTEHTDRVDFGSLTHEQKAALRILLRRPQETPSPVEAENAPSRLN